MSTILDLSDAEGFAPIPAGSYNATVYETELVKTSGSGKLPEGVKMVKVRFAVQDEPHVGFPIFGNFPLPSAGESEHWKRMLGSFLSFLVAVGEDEKKVKTKGFDLDNLGDLEGRECVIRVAMGKATEEYPEPGNVLKGVKPAGSPTSSAEDAAESRAI